MADRNEHWQPYNDALDAAKLSPEDRQQIEDAVGTLLEGEQRWPLDHLVIGFGNEDHMGGVEGSGVRPLVAS